MMPFPACSPPTIRATLAAPIDPEPLTLDEAKLRAGLDWTPGDARDALMLEFITAARQQVETDTGIAVPVQARDLFFDTLPSSIAWRDLPPQSSPLRSVTSITAINSAGVSTVLDPTAYTVAITNDALVLTILTTPADTQRWVVRIESGFEPIPPSLLQAVGLLTAHYATVGRDLTIVGTTAAETPLGYCDAIAGWQVVRLI